MCLRFCCCVGISITTVLSLAGDEPAAPIEIQFVNVPMSIDGSAGEWAGVPRHPITQTWEGRAAPPADDLTVAAAFAFDETDRKTKLIHEKERIASFAASLVEDFETILVDSGSTTYQLSKFIRDKNQLTVITNSLDIVNELSQIGNITLISVGGIFPPELSIFAGFQAEAALSNFKVGKLFIGCQGISLERGLLDSNFFVINLRKKMIETADRVFLLADHTKFGRNAPAVVAPLEKLDCIITDRNVNSSWKDALSESGVKVVVAGPVEKAAQKPQHKD